MSAASTRQAGLADISAIGRLRRAWTEQAHGAPIDDPMFEGEFTTWFQREVDQRVTWLAEIASEAVGMLNLFVFTRMPKPRSADAPGPARQWGYIANVYVAPAHRGDGLGEALLDAAIAYADANGFARLVLSPSERSIPLYGRAGFEPATTLMVRPQPDVSADDRQPRPR